MKNRKIIGIEGKLYLIISNDYNKKKYKSICNVYISKMVKNPETDIIIEKYTEEKNYIANLNTIKSIMLPKAINYIKTISDYYDRIITSNLVIYKSEEVKNTYLKYTMRDAEKIDRMNWTIEKLGIHYGSKKNITPVEKAIYLINLGKNIGNELEKPRPCIVWKKIDTNNSLIIPLISSEKEIQLDTQINNQTSYVDIKNFKVVSNKRIIKVFYEIEKNFLKINENEINAIGENLFSIIF